MTCNWTITSTNEHVEIYHWTAIIMIIEIILYNNTRCQMITDCFNKLLRHLQYILNPGDILGSGVIE